MSDTANPNPDWYPDPTGRYEQRYWDGSQWTEHVSSAGQQRTDPLPGGSAPSAVSSELPGLGQVAPGGTAPSGPEPVAPAAAPAPVTPPPATTGPAPEWYPDPTGRYELRYWNGTEWTEHVTASGQQGVDPLPDESRGDETGGAVSTAGTEAASPAGTAGAGPEAEDAPSAADEPTPEPAEAQPGIIPFVEDGAAGSDTGETAGGSEIEEAAETATGDQGTAGSTAAPVADQTMPTPSPTGPAPDWYPDPTGRQELRYWDGTQWTEHASTAGRQVVDPIS